ncbi:MAG TPA: YceI family protein [Aridibacter sp.]|nr:YceI family protein [Aridibacter sp.]
MRRSAVLSLGSFAAAALLAFGGFFFVSNATTPTIEQRFDIIASDDSLSKAEQKGAYGFDRAHSYIGFRIKHMGLVEVPGSFTDFAGDIVFDPDDLKSSSVEFTAQMKSVNTRVEGRDNHLRSKDFFEVETYPEMKFKSASIAKKGDGYIVTGSLTMKDVTKAVSIPVKVIGPIEDSRGTVRMGIVGSTEINRRDFNVNYGGDLPNGTPVLADNVSIDLQIESVKKKEEEAPGQ